MTKEEFIKELKKINIIQPTGVNDLEAMLFADFISIEMS